MDCSEWMKKMEWDIMLHHINLMLNQMNSVCVLYFLFTFIRTFVEVEKLSLSLSQQYYMTIYVKSECEHHKWVVKMHFLSSLNLQTWWHISYNFFTSLYSILRLLHHRFSFSLTMWDSETFKISEDSQKRDFTCYTKKMKSKIIAN